MEIKELEKLAELKTSLFSYRNGYKTFKDAFVEGFLVGETNPNDETIEKIARLVWQWNHYMSQTFGDIDNKEDCLSYIKNHWND